MNVEQLKAAVALLEQLSPTETATKGPDEGESQIVVIPHGWVLQGTRFGDTLKDAKVVRVWGTTKGLGELANGPTAKTKFDPMPDVRVESALFSFPVNGW